MKTGDQAGPRGGAFSPQMRLTDEGLELGRGVLLAKWDDAGLCVGEDRLITLLAIARRDDIPQTAGLAVKRAAKHWRSGDRALAAIHLAQIGLRKIDEDDAERLALAAALVDAGMSARELARELGLNVQSGARKYSDDQPRVPAGNGRASGQWASGEGGAGEAPVVEGRSAISGRWRAVGGVNRVKDLPKDAVVVKRPDGSAVEDSESTTGKLMAPPRANFQEIYAAGKEISARPLSEQFVFGREALGHFGTYDFQRDRATNTFYTQYIQASNYAVGVYMAGAGYSLAGAHAIARGYALWSSSNGYSYKSREWTTQGWEDAQKGVWR